jgi:hypothetical protein
MQLFITDKHLPPVKKYPEEQDVQPNIKEHGR